MPLYNDISRLTLGLSKDAKLSAHPGYAVSKPVVYYGSSIPQGAAASRPGMSYEGIISRRLNGDFINLGFAGNAKGVEKQGATTGSWETSAIFNMLSYAKTAKLILDANMLTK